MSKERTFFAAHEASTLIRVSPHEDVFHLQIVSWSKTCFIFVTWAVFVSQKLSSTRNFTAIANYLVIWGLINAVWRFDFRNFLPFLDAMTPLRHFELLFNVLVWGGDIAAWGFLAVWIIVDLFLHKANLDFLLPFLPSHFRASQSLLLWLLKKALNLYLLVYSWLTH